MILRRPNGFTMSQLIGTASVLPFLIFLPRSGMISVERLLNGGRRTSQFAQQRDLPFHEEEASHLLVPANELAILSFLDESDCSNEHFQPKLTDVWFSASEPGRSSLSVPK